MSGIAAILGPPGSMVEPSELGRMLGAQTHRGPDGCHGRFVGSGALGHLHFWTTPEEAGEVQPLCGAGGSLLLAFDGRLDNRGELWRSLPTSPGPLAELSDGALVLAAYEAWGREALSRFLGPFAVAVLDARGGAPELLLARDPLGGRPLVYAREGDTVIAASEEMGILAHPRVEPDLCRERMAVFFAVQELADGKTFFRGIEQVLPGHGVRVAGGGLEHFRFWSPDLRGSALPRSDDELAEEFRGLLARSVACRMRATRTPAVLLSGGLDSAPISALASRHLRAGDRLKTFTWVFDQYPDSDERFYVEAMARELPLDSQHILCDDAWPLAGGEDWPVHPTTPEQNPYRLFHERAYRGARSQGARVLLSGMTGDQLYSGIDGWMYDLLLRGRVGAALDELRLHLAPGRRWKLLRGLIPARRSARRPTAGTWLTPEATRLLPAGAPWPAAAAKARRPHQGVQLLGLMNGHGFAVEAYYSGRVGLELRYPFRDRRLIELMLRLPTDQLYRKGMQRPILRRALEGQLPGVILRRKEKASFASIFFKGLVYEERSRVDRLLDGSSGFWPGFVREDWLRKVRSQGTMNESEWVVLWSCLCAEIWHRRRSSAIFRSAPPKEFGHETETVSVSESVL